MRISNRGRKFPAQPLDGDEVKTLIRACSQQASTGIRNAALIATMYRTGLRVGEALSIRPKDLDVSAGAIRVLNGKGGTVRTVGMDPARGRCCNDGWTAGLCSGSMGTRRSSAPSEERR